MKPFKAATSKLWLFVALLFALPAFAAKQNAGDNDTVIFDAFGTAFWTEVTDVDKSGTSVGVYAYTGPGLGFIRTPSGDFAREGLQNSVADVLGAELM